MTLPPEIQAQAGGCPAGEPKVVVRSSSDLEGNPGETYVAVDESSLFLFNRRLGEPYRVVRFPLRDVEDVSLVPEGLYTNLEIIAEAQHPALRFPSWDKADLQRIVDCWQVASGRTSRHAGMDSGGMPLCVGGIGSAVAVSPRVALSASLHAMAESDGESCSREREEIARVLGAPAVFDEGAAFLRQHGVEALLASLSPLLNPAQKRCLVANLLSLAMVDGLLRSAEQKLADRFQSALAMADGDFQSLREILLTKHNLSVFAEDPAPEAIRIEPVPLTIFCAAVLALIEVDGVAAEEEREAQQRLIEDSNAWEAGGTLLVERGGGGLPGCLKRLNRAQQRCLLVNLLAVGMCDGWLRTSEQELIDRFRQAMSFTREEHDVIFRALLGKEDLSVFA
jgi:uncharacterized tellurite resistance protein B-like protein